MPVESHPPYPADGQAPGLKRRDKRTVLSARGPSGAGAAHPHLGRTPEVFSVTLADCLPQLKWTIQSLASLASPPKVIIGGSVVNKHPEVATQSGADGTAPTFIEAIKEGNRLLGVTRRPLSLENYLELLGSRVQECRRELGWNQQRLADTSGLDRT